MFDRISNDKELADLIRSKTAVLHPNMSDYQAARMLLRVFEEITPEEYAEMYRAIFSPGITIHKDAPE